MMTGQGLTVTALDPDVEGLDRADLSPWFNPFLTLFVRETRRCGGEVRVIREGAGVAGLVISDPVERVTTVFSRSRPIAEAVVQSRGSCAVYSDFSFEPSAEPFDIFSTAVEGDPPIHRFRHSIRPLSKEDLPVVLDLMREVLGAVNDRWFDGLPTPSEAGFVAEVDGHVAGVAWVSRVGDHARLHSLTVRPPYRRMGLGTDLLFARLLWARRTGAREVLSEISERNVASQAIAARGGMHRVGRIYFHRPL